MLLLLAACDGGLLGTCEESTTPTVGACYGGGDITSASDTGGSEATISWSATVLEVGSGRPDACSYMHGSVTSSAWWVRMEVDGNDAWVAMDVPGSTIPAVGDALTIAAFHREAAFGPTEAAVEVREGSALVAWSATAGGLDTMTVPSELSLAQGDATCAESSSCGAWSEYRLEATVGADTVTLVEGESDAVGTLTITNAGLRSSTRSSGCPDWYVAEASVAVGG